MKKNSALSGSAFLFGAAFIWGLAFVAQSVGLDYTGPFTFNGTRCLLGGITLLPFALAFRKKMPESTLPGLSRGRIPVLLEGGLICGLFLCIASNLQQAGLQYTTVGKAGFITAMYIVLVPLIGIFLGRRAGRNVWIGVALAVGGLYLLSASEGLAIGRGDLLTLGCALAFAFQILAVDYYSRRCGGVQLACLEFWVCGLLTMIPMMLTEKPSWQALIAARIPLLYTGVLSCGIAYTLQILGQKRLPPALASLIMSFEAVISALGGWLILGQSLSRREVFGCIVMFAAMIAAQLPGREENGQEAGSRDTGRDGTRTIGGKKHAAQKG